MRISTCLCIVLFLSIISCKDAIKIEPLQEAIVISKATLRTPALPKKVKHPKNNPISKQKIELGRLLFYDPILSGDRDVACVTCHHPNSGYAEFKDISIGVNGQGLGSKRHFKKLNSIPFVKRNAQTILNTAFNDINSFKQYDPEKASMFWDKRVESLEKQALEPIKALEEMRGLHFAENEILIEVVTRLKNIPEYVALFNIAFEEKESINSTNLAKAIAVFERTLVANNSRFDMYMRGDKFAISESEKQGLQLFKESGCINCHNGPMFSDYKHHVLGVPENEKLSELDRGIKDSFSFRTPSLRNLRFTAPYMHNGSFQSLKQVLEFYEDISGGKSKNKAVLKEQFDPFIKKIELKVKDMSLIISFLNTLNDGDFDKVIPERVPSGLPVGGNIINLI